MKISLYDKELKSQSSNGKLNLSPSGKHVKIYINIYLYYFACREMYYENIIMMDNLHYYVELNLCT